MMRDFDKALTALSMGALLLSAVPAFAARPECGDGKCNGRENSLTCPEDCPADEPDTDIPVCATLGDHSEDRIFSDDAGAYCNSLGNGIYAFFQHEAGPTSDLWVNLIDSEREFVVDFSDFLLEGKPDSACMPLAWINGSTTGWRIFVDEVDNIPVDGTPEWDLFCQDTHQDCDLDGKYVRRRGTFFLDDDVNKVTFELRFQMADWQDFDVNDPMPTSYLKVHHTSSDTWVITPELIGTDAVATLLRKGKGRNNTTSCGQFSMPSELTVCPLAASGCGPTP